ncbi:MAG TPA: hypothetical protein VFC07_11420 [Verrucomicrobiae bacterium]|nr:hypothetical protein [Verrucomicrobiae bacterium]
MKLLKLKMKAIARGGLLLFVPLSLLLMTGCATNSNIVSAPLELQSKYPPLSPEGAKNFYVLSGELLKSPFARSVTYHNVTETNDTRYISYISPQDNQEYVIDLSSIIPSSIQITYAPGDFSTLAAWKASWKMYNTAQEISFLTSLWSQNDAQAVADSVRYLAMDARQRNADNFEEQFQQFRPKAAAWLALSEKPAMPEEARNHKVLAENAIRNKDLKKADEEYQQALKIFPCWPDGQFNEASIAGGLGYYRTAILHMKCYMELEPNAPDLQSDKDKITIWQDGLGH